MLYVGVQEQTNIAGQVNLVNDMVVRKVAGILIAATDAKALAPAVDKAIDKGVPVITLDSGVNYDKPYAYIATDNIGAAKMAAKTMAELIGGKGKIGDIGITAGSQTGREREQGFLDGMKAHPDIKVLGVQYSGCDPAKALNIATDLMTANPDLAASTAPATAAAPAPASSSSRRASRARCTSSRSTPRLRNCSCSRTATSKP